MSVMMVVAMLLAACVTPSAPAPAPAAGEAEAAPAAEDSGAAAAEAPARRLKICATVPTLNAQFMNRYFDFMTKGADELGVDLIKLNADNVPDNMPKFIEDCVAQGVDGMIHFPYWSSDRKALEDTRTAGIPLVFTDVYSEVPPQSADYPNYIAFVGPSDEDAGYQMANALFAAMTPDENGKKVIGWVEGTAGTSVAIDRNKGLEKALAENADVEVACKVNGNFVRDESQKVFESCYQAHPEIKGVWAANGGTATGVMTALKDAGKVPGEDVVVVAMDLNPENVEAVKNGELLFDIGGHWLQGGFALVLLYDHLNGLPVPADQANVKLKLLPLTQDKVEVFEKCFPDGVPAYDFKDRSRALNPDAPPAAFDLEYCE